MTAYNRQDFITEAIESVLRSKRHDWELIVVDDCSIDRTYTIATQFKQKDHRIRVIRNDKNLGDYTNRNLAASYAAGKYITYLDSDDYYLEDGLSYIVEQMEQEPEADWGIYDPGKKMKCLMMNSSEAIDMHFFHQPFLTIGPGGTIIKRLFFERIGGYPEKYGPANDNYFNLKAAASGNTLILTSDFFHYRLHEGQQLNNRFAYLYYNYNNQRDAFAELKLPLSESQIQWLIKKNKRRLSVNLVRFFLKDKSLKRLKYIIEKTEFSYRDFIQGIFHLG